MYALQKFIQRKVVKFCKNSFSDQVTNINLIVMACLLFIHTYKLLIKAGYSNYPHSQPSDTTSITLYVHH